MSLLCLALLLAVPAFSAAPVLPSSTIDPAHATNITLYHVNERNFSSTDIRNMNTADMNGDIYFDIRSRGLPLECGPLVNTSFWSRLDCDNPEVATPTSELAVTQLVLEVDTRWGDYANCNINPQTGGYECSCQDVDDDCRLAKFANKQSCDDARGCYWDSGDGRCETYGCANITDKEECTQGYRTCVWTSAKNGTCHEPPGPKPVCDHSKVGFLNLSTVDWGRHSHHSMSKVDYWHGNTLIKTNGLWFSTWPEGECKGGLGDTNGNDDDYDGDDDNDKASGACSWRIVSSPAPRKISKVCSDASIDATIMDGDANAPWGARCFSKCSDGDRRNTSSACYIQCFYDNVLGKKGSSTLMNHSSPDFGIPLAELQAAWAKPFLPVEQGGCPNIA